MTNLTSNIQNIESSRSSIEDADFAAEAADLAKNQILAQSATAMLAQASTISQNILSSQLNEDLLVAETASLTPTRRNSVFFYMLLCIKGICYPNRSLFFMLAKGRLDVLEISLPLRT